MTIQWTIDLIIRECGGPPKVAAVLGLTESAVAKMRRNGIKDRHWLALMALGADQFDASDIFAANEAARQPPVSDTTDGQGAAGATGEAA